MEDILIKQLFSSFELHPSEDFLLPETKLPLYPYQEDGVKFLLDNQRCILGDEMGLGKTLQALATIKTLDTDNAMRVLIVCPKGAKPVWRLEIKKWLNEEDIEVADSLEGWLVTAMKFLEPKKRFLVCNYEQLREFSEQMLKNAWHMIVFDEAHRLRNNDTKLYRAVNKICVSRIMTPMIFITGTPLVNSPKDLYSLLHLIDPVTFSNEKRFLSTWFYVSSYGAGAMYKHKSVERFQEFISRYMIRRMRKDVIDLPPVKSIELPIELEGEQLKFYKNMRDSFIASFEGKENMSVTVLIAQIMRLKQICLCPGLMLPGNESCEGAKLESLLELLADTDEKTVITSSFSSYLRPLAKRLRLEGYKVGIITGGTNEKDRAEQVKKFQETDELTVFLLSSKAGGEAITLTAAGNFIQLDKPWTAAEEDQVFGRVYRIGQDKKVFRYYLKAMNTVEQYIETVIDRKRKMFGDSIPISEVRRLLGV